MKKVKVIDSECGTGKTALAIKYMNSNHLNKRFIFVTPYLDEVKRIVENTKFTIKQPTGTNKYQSFLKLVEDGENIVTTHSLFSMADDNLIELLMAQEYNLILDEVMTVLGQLNFMLGDLDSLIESSINVAHDGTLSLNDYGNSRLQKGTEFDKRLKVVQAGRAIKLSDSIIMWLFPVDIFNAMSSVTILTYMFQKQVMYNFLKSNNIEFEYYHLVDCELVSGRCRYNGSKYKDLIEIYDGKLNSIGNKKSAFSANYFKGKHNKKFFNMLSKNTYNYFRHICNVKSADTMWTTRKQNYVDGLVSVQGHKESFLSVNARATNKYKNKTVCAYLYNRYENPSIDDYFRKNGLSIDKDIFALSELIQWLFRSAIREGNPIKLYIPSSRMRNLLIAWLNDEVESLIDTKIINDDNYDYDQSYETYEA